MIFFKHENDKIIINDIQIDFEIFLQLEPDYQKPSKAISVTYIPDQTHTWSDGIETFVIGRKWIEGDRYISRLDEFLKLQRVEDEDTADTEKLVQREQEKRLEYTKKRRSEYPKVEELVVALWEHIVEKKNLDDSHIKQIQVLREKIKSDYPKDTTVTKKRRRKKVNGRTNKQTRTN
jgi:hypothetical protein